MEAFFGNIRRCSVCILPETFPGISFDEKGVCNYCKDYTKVEVLGEEALERELLRYRGKGETFDCLVPISGGRDSSYILYQIVKKFKMRSLAITVDSGAITPEGYCNIEKVTKSVGVEHVWLKDENHVVKARKNTV